MHADHELDLPVRWFTGKQWADGTATRQFKQDYKEAIARKQPEQSQRKKKYQPPVSTWKPWWTKVGNNG